MFELVRSNDVIDMLGMEVVHISEGCIGQDHRLTRVGMISHEYYALFIIGQMVDQISGMKGINECEQVARFARWFNSRLCPQPKEHSTHSALSWAPGGGLYDLSIPSHCYW